MNGFTRHLSKEVFLWAAVAAVLVAAASTRPLWRMTLLAPQYPAGLELTAYGDRLEGDLREINIINHYVGMSEIEPVPAPEMALFPWGLGALIALIVLAPWHRRLHWLAVAAVCAAPVVILGDLQWWLHRFGHDLDPKAPLRFDDFTPLVLGNSNVGNFTTEARVGTGILLLLGAAVLLGIGLWRRRERPDPMQVSRRSVDPRAALMTLVMSQLLALGIAAPAWCEAASLQDQIDALPPGGVLEIDGGVHEGPIVVHGPLTLRGLGQPVIDGGGDGTVVTVHGEGAVIEGFVIRHGGRVVSQEPAGIKARGSHHRFANNRVEDVYFGIHLSQGANVLVANNEIEPGFDAVVVAASLRREGRTGHAVSLWTMTDSLVEGNVIRDARDGVYLSFTERVTVRGNDVERCRYGVHSMYSQDAALVENRLSRNLLGAALMYSDRLEVRGNRIERHRVGATAYGLLLKDIGELTIENNQIVGNRVGIYADSVPVGVGKSARVVGNLLAANEAALALQSNVELIVAGNSIVDNLTDARAEGARLAAGNRWSEGGRGNHWGSYRGYDLDGDGIGDQPYRVEALMDRLLAERPEARAFLYTPAHAALEVAARLFPLLRREPLVEDVHPLMRDPLTREAREVRAVGLQEAPR